MTDLEKDLATQEHARKTIVRALQGPLCDVEVALISAGLKMDHPAVRALAELRREMHAARCDAMNEIERLVEMTEDFAA